MIHRWSYGAESDRLRGLTMALLKVMMMMMMITRTTHNAYARTR
jgi:hypothetical protein